MKRTTTSRQRIALFGGTFDPLHIGHLFVADEVRLTLGYERVIMVPTAQPPHKSDSPAASARDRLAMLQGAIDPAWCGVDAWEIERGGQSYTIDTVRHLLDTGRFEGKPGLIIGDDLVENFHSWREYESLLALTNLIVVRRDDARLPPDLSEVTTIDITPLPVSSSMVRERIREERAYRYLVPEGVYRYIEKHQLYRSDENP